MLPLKLHARSGTVTEYRPVGSTVTAMLSLPTMVTAAWAGIARTKEETANNVARNTCRTPREIVNLCKPVPDHTIVPR
jgi:hypothetical protein